MNKFEKKLACIVRIGVVLYTQQSEKASKSYQKLLDRFDHALNDCWWNLPVKDAKQVDSIHRIIVNYKDKAFDPDGHPSEVYTSLLLAMIEDTLPTNAYEKTSPTITDSKRLSLFQKLHSAVMQMHRYWDRRLNKTDRGYYQQADKMFEKWRWV